MRFCPVYKIKVKQMKTTILDDFKVLKRTAQKAMLSTVNWAALDDYRSYPVHFFTNDEMDNLAGLFSAGHGGDKRRSEIAAAAAARALAMRKIYDEGKAKGKRQIAGEEGEQQVTADGPVGTHRELNKMLSIVKRMTSKGTSKKSHYDELAELRAVAASGDAEKIASVAELEGLSALQMEILGQLSDDQLNSVLKGRVAGTVAAMFIAWQAAQAKKASLPARRSERDFFIADLLDITFRDDMHSMSAPFYSLSTRKQKPGEDDFFWVSVDGQRSVEIKSISSGRATMRDKNILIYAVSQLVEGKKRGREDAHNREVVFTLSDYFAALETPVAGSSYDAVVDGLGRLQGTQIKTNIKTGKGKYGHTSFFGLVDSAELIEDPRGGKWNATVKLVLSEWLFGAVEEYKAETLTIPKEYFRLTKPLEMRLYELARKHCGQQALINWTWEMLYKASGSAAEMKEFKRMIGEIIAAGVTPEYKFTITPTGIAVSQKK